MSGRKTGALAAAVVIASLVFMGCARAGAGDGSPRATSPTAGLGSSFTLPAGLIEDWREGDGDQASVLLFDADGFVVHEYGPVTIDAGFFPGLLITAPPQEALLTVDDLANDFNAELETSDPNARFQFFEELDITGFFTTDLAYRETDDTLVGWMYADRNVEITAEEVTTVTGVTTTMIIDLNLVTGWNRTVFNVDEAESTVAVTTGPEPAGARWVM